MSPGVFGCTLIWDLACSLVLLHEKQWKRGSGWKRRERGVNTACVGLCRSFHFIQFSFVRPGINVCLSLSPGVTQYMIGTVIIVQIKSCSAANPNLQRVSQVWDSEPAYDLQHYKLNGHSDLAVGNYLLNGNMKVALRSVRYFPYKHGNVNLWRAESMFRMIRASSSKFGGRQKGMRSLTNLQFILGGGGRPVCVKCQCNQSGY